MQTSLARQAITTIGAVVLAVMCTLIHSPALFGGQNTLPAIGIALLSENAPAAQALQPGQHLATQNQFPWMVETLKQQGTAALQPNCGGTLVGDRWVLTAKHCEEDPIATGDQAVRVGSTSATSGGTVVGVHHTYIDPDRRDDIALLELKKPVNAQTLPIAPAALSHKAYAKGQQALTIGWGSNSAGDDHHSTRLHWSNQTITWSDVTATNGGVFYAGRPHGAGSATCEGDSGGPLVWSPAGFAANGRPRGKEFVVGTLRGLNNESCFVAGQNDDFQSTAGSSTLWINDVMANA